MNTLGKATVTRARITLPRWGVWTAQVSTDSDAGLSKGAVATLIVADLTLVGHLVRGGVDKGGAGTYQLAGGANGWRKRVPSRGYRNGAPVKLLTALSDLARDAGEVINTASVPQRALGTFWERPAAVASFCLERLSPRAWYTGEDGQTRLGRRPASSVALAPELILRRNPARADALLASESIAQIVPEASVNDLGKVDTVLHLVSASALRTVVRLDGGAS